jgi:hypothetical protein
MQDHTASTSPLDSAEPSVPANNDVELTAEALAIMAEESAAYERECDQAAVELQEEQHQSLGMMDTVKTMFMWMESPEERISKNRSHQDDST